MRVTRLTGVIVSLFAVLLGGCNFRPMYAETELVGSGPAVMGALRQVEVASIGGQLGNDLRNDLIFELTGGHGNPANAPYRLTMTIRISSHNTIIDRLSGRSAAVVTALDVEYKLHDVVQDRIVLTERALARTSFDSGPQLFANFRASKEARSRAAKIIAEQVRSRLATYFLTQT
jgi:LPS-assembly lipoprotein